MESDRAKLKQIKRESKILKSKVNALDLVLIEGFISLFEKSISTMEKILTKEHFEDYCDDTASLLATLGEARELKKCP